MCQSQRTNVLRCQLENIFLYFCLWVMVFQCTKAQLINTLLESEIQFGLDTHCIRTEGEQGKKKGWKFSPFPVRKVKKVMWWSY